MNLLTPAVHTSKKYYLCSSFLIINITNMFRHFLKISFRNLWKYKSQTLISVIGLATGFACFAIATLWIRYEMTFDSFHKNADRLYRVSVKCEDKSDELSKEISMFLNLYLKNTFPEVNDATDIVYYPQYEIKIDDIDCKGHVIWTDSSFLKIFDIKILAGNSDFLIPENKQIAITREKAQQLFGNENPIGKTVSVMGQYTIGAVVNGFAKHSNYSFDMLAAYDPVLMSSNLIVELRPKIDKKSLFKKLYEHKGNVEQKTYRFTSISSDGWKGLGELLSYPVLCEQIVLTPLTSIHYTDPYIFRTVKFQHVIIFAVVGSLLILCTLLNYLALFAGRFRTRQRELALRIVCGASNKSLFALLSVEFLMSLTVSLLLGVALIKIIIPQFKLLSKVDIELSSIYIESLIYIVLIILISLLVFLSVLMIFRRRALNVAIRSSNKKMFRKVSIIVQLIISINFAFCTVMILKQMYFLHNTDLGFDLKYVGSIDPWEHDMDAVSLENKLKQIPEITATLKGFSLTRSHSSGGDYLCSLEGHPDDKKNVEIEIVYTSPEIANFYKFRLLSGEMLTESDSREYVLINESAAQALGGYESTGKVLSLDSNEHYIVKGVIKNIYKESPTTPVKPTVYKHKHVHHNEHSVLFKYKAGTWKTCKDKITQLIKEKNSEFDSNSINMLITNEEKIFDEMHLQSENILLKILSIVSLVCVIVCVFGFVSMVSLTCEERRKEIAIRKINGATVKDILDIFFKEHLTLLGIGALIAFPIGYLIMKRWLEQYVLQTEISAWIYVSILLALIMVIVLCVGGKVYRTSRENPVEAIKG
jgi:ABC-type antimicrobial peptide transport system permease subunit